jgi:predicted thioesterase
MNINEIVYPGIAKEMVFRVGEEQLAAHIGSGTMRVLATPAMIGYMERVSQLLLAEYLPEGYSSVGILVEARHLAPTPFGFEVRVRSEIIAVEGSRVTFHVQVWDPIEQVGEARHDRMVIDESRFLRRVNAKTEQLQK